MSLTSNDIHRKKAEEALKHWMEKWKNLEGKWFHILDEDCYTVDRQGHVLSYLGDGYYVIQYYDFLMGAPSNISVVHISEMAEPLHSPSKRWVFYETAEDMRDAYECNYSKKPPERTT